MHGRRTRDVSHKLKQRSFQVVQSIKNALSPQWSRLHQGTVLSLSLEVSKPHCTEPWGTWSDLRATPALNSSLVYRPPEVPSHLNPVILWWLPTHPRHVYRWNMVRYIVQKSFLRIWLTVDLNRNWGTGSYMISRTSSPLFSAGVLFSELQTSNGWILNFTNDTFFYNKTSEVHRQKKLLCHLTGQTFLAILLSSIDTTSGPKHSLHGSVLRGRAHIGGFDSHNNHTDRG